MTERKFFQVSFGNKKIIIYSKVIGEGYEAIFEHEGILCFASVINLSDHVLYKEGNIECMIFPIDPNTHEIDFGTELYINRTDSKDMLWFIKQCIDDFTEEYHAS